MKAFQFIFLTIVACALASPIDDKSSARSTSSSNPDISKLPLKKDGSNSTLDSGVQAHPLHKRGASDPPRVVSLSSSANTQTSSTPSSVTNSQTSTTSGHKGQPSLSNPSLTRVSREAQINHAAPNPVTQSSLKSQPTPTPSQNYNVHSVYNQQTKPANVPTSQPIQKAPSSNLSPLSQAKNQPILSQNSRVKRDTPRVTASVPQKASIQPQKAQVPAIPLTNQKQAAPIPSQASRKTRDAPTTADPKNAPALNKKPEDQNKADNKKSTDIVTPSQFAITNSRPVRDAPNPVEQSKIVPSANQPNVESKSSNTVTASPPLVAKVPQQKRESLPLQSSTDSQTPQFVHPVPVDQILKKQKTSASSESVENTSSKNSSSKPVSGIEPLPASVPTASTKS